MAIKNYEVTVNYLFGLTTIVNIKANTERKAKIKAIQKVQKEKNCSFAYVTKCIEIKD